MYSTVIGKIHPSFFDCSNTFAKMNKEKTEKGVVLTTPFFTLEYDSVEMSLSCDDELVLKDFVEILDKEYGAKVTREELHDSVDWGNVTGDWNKLSFGTCVLDDVSGWDGSINSVWYDNDAPGEVIHVHTQFWNKRVLFDAHKLDIQELKNTGKFAVMPNLVEALLLSRGNELKHSKIEQLIGEIS